MAPLHQQPQTKPYVQLQLMTYLSSCAVAKQNTSPSAVPFAAGAKCYDHHDVIRMPRCSSPPNRLPPFPTLQGAGPLHTARGSNCR